MAGDATGVHLGRRNYHQTTSLRRLALNIDD